MNSQTILETLDSLLDGLAAALAPRIAAKLQEVMPTRPNRLLTVKQIAAHLGIGETSARNLIKSGALKRAPGLKDIRVRQDVLDAYAAQ